jgi:hypothetical protein
MADLKDMTEEEAEYWDDYFTKNIPKGDPAKPGVFARRGANRFAGLDDLSVDYLLTKAIATRKTPEEIIGELIHKEIAASAGAPQ